MSGVEIKLLTERNIENGLSVQVYDVGGYEVAARGQKDLPSSRIFVYIQRKSGCTERYLPSLSVYSREDNNANIFIDIYVDTTSYGSLPLDEIACFMEEMQSGIEAAKIIEQKILKPIEHGTWNWEVLQ